MDDLSGPFEIEKWLIRRQMALLGDPPVTMVIGNGSTVCPAKGKSVGTVLIRDRKTLLRFAVHPELHFGDAYCEGNIEVEGRPDRRSGSRISGAWRRYPKQVWSRCENKSSPTGLA